MDLRSNTKQYITPELFGVFYGLLNFRLVLSMSNIFLYYTFPVNSFSARLGCVPTISHFILQSPIPVSLSYGVNAKTYPDAGMAGMCFWIQSGLITMLLQCY